MANPELIDYLFSNLSDYLKKIKEPLYQIQTQSSLNAETIDILQQNKAVLEEIKRKCDLYKEYVNSTIQHINDILPQPTGYGVKHKRKTRKKHYRRKSRNHN